MHNYFFLCSASAAPRCLSIHNTFNYKLFEEDYWSRLPPIFFLTVAPLRDSKAHVRYRRTADDEISRLAFKVVLDFCFLVSLCKLNALSTTSLLIMKGECLHFLTNLVLYMITL